MGMRVKVRMLGVFREAGGAKEVYVEAPDDASLRVIIDNLIGDDRELHSVLWDTQVDSPLPNALILLDGVEVNNLQGMDTLIEDGQELVLLSVVHGG